jgi:hypothetical protein
MLNLAFKEVLRIKKEQIIRLKILLIIIIDASLHILFWLLF